MLSDRAGEAVTRVMDRLERGWYPNLAVDVSESWDYQAWPVDKFLAGLEVAATLTDGRVFVDVGSGIGTKLALAAEMGWEPYGVEFRPQYSVVSRYICPEAKVVTLDARVVTTYGSFDLIYAYLPLRGPLMRELVSEISRQAKPTAALFLPETDDISDLGWRLVDDHPIWVRS